ncbi:hypothetical protein BGZ76_004064, partial [Entomortierella beljakovae]
MTKIARFITVAALVLHSVTLALPSPIPRNSNSTLELPSNSTLPAEPQPIPEILPFEGEGPKWTIKEKNLNETTFSGGAVFARKPFEGYPTIN